MKSGVYDGSRRNYFFPRIETVNRARGDIAPCGRIIGMILLKAIDSGRIEDDLAHLEAAMTGTTGREIEAFDFRPAKGGSTDEKPATPYEGD